MQVGGKKRLKNIDCVRGVAAASVMLEHAMEYGGVVGQGAAGLATNYINFGELGVVAFFLVSGFVIPLSLERWNDLGRFWVSRALRIYPLYLAVMAISWYFANSPITFKAILAQLTFLSGYLKTTNLVGNSWTLSLEAVWYIIFSLLFVFKANARPVFATVSMCLVLIGGISACLIGINVPMGRVGMIATCFVGLFIYRIWCGFEVKRHGYCLAVLLPMIAFGLVARFGLRSHPSVDSPRLLCVLLSWMGAYTLFIGSFLLKLSDLVEQTLAQLGKISFSVYLVHTFGVWVMGAAGLSGWAYVAGVVLFTIPVSVLSYNLIERPAIQLSHRYPKRYNPATAAEA